MATFIITEYYSYTCDYTIEAENEEDAMDILDSDPLVNGKDNYEYEDRKIQKVDNPHNLC